MALHYRTEYGLGRRGRVCRSYTGFQAFVAIAFDLVFGLLFELVWLTFALAARLAVEAARLAARSMTACWRILIAAMTLVVYVVTLPFAWIHEAVDRLQSPRRGDEPAGDPRGPGAIRKPSWALSREV